MSVLKLERKDWDRAYREALDKPRLDATFTMAMFLTEWEQARTVLNEELCSRWCRSSFDGNDEDYALSNEPSDIRQLPIGIYSKRIFCPDFIKSVQTALCRIPAPYVGHVACEMSSGKASDVAWGEIFVTKNQAVICSDAKDLAVWFVKNDAKTK